MFRVVYNRINDSMFRGLKYAEIYPEADWLYGEPIKICYGLTWNSVHRRAKRWCDKHFDDRFI